MPTSNDKIPSQNGIVNFVQTIRDTSREVFKESGIVKGYKRFKAKPRNVYSAHEAEVIILVGTEKGSTARFASAVFDQLIAADIPTHIADMNDYRLFPVAKYLICFCSTYGDGEAPKTASKFNKKLKKSDPQLNPISFSVLGFGATSYGKFCAYAKKTHKRLSKQSWAIPVTELLTVNKRSIDDFLVWVQAWNEATGYKLSTAAETYKKQISKKK